MLVTKRCNTKHQHQQTGRAGEKGQRAHPFYCLSVSRRLPSLRADCLRTIGYTSIGCHRVVLLGEPISTPFSAYRPPPGGRGHLTCDR